MTSKLFGTSGIRGIANIEVTPQLALNVGEALVSECQGGVIAVGRDARITGEMLESALVSGLTSCGADVKILGIVPTPTLAYLTKEMKADAGVAITASHNPPQYNGFKIFDSGGQAYTEEREEKLERRIRSGQFSRKKFDEVGRAERVELSDAYIDAISKRVRLEGDWKVACDLFNGATGTILPKLLRELGCKSTFLNAQPDGHFPSGSPEPTTSALRRLAALVKEMGLDLGFGFDGDGDRMMTVDEMGCVPEPDRVLAAYARHVVERAGGGVVVTHVGASRSLDEAMKGTGGSVVRTKVGDVSIAKAIKKREAVFGGEPAGAWIHPKVHMCPDGMLSALRLMEALEEEGKTLSKFLEGIPEYVLLEQKVDCPNSMKSKALEWMILNHDVVFGGEAVVDTLDGIRLDLKEGWVLIRPSGTEPVIRLTTEAEDSAHAERLLGLGSKLIRNALSVK